MAGLLGIIRLNIIRVLKDAEKVAASMRSVQPQHLPCIRFSCGFKHGLNIPTALRSITVLDLLNKVIK